MDSHTQPAAAAEDPSQADAGSTFVAVIENRAKEVGLAALDLGCLTLQLSQYIEPGRHYANTQLALQLHSPKRLILVGSNHHEVSASGLNKLLTSISSSYDTAHVSRSCFDDTQGAAAVQQLASSDLSKGNGSSALSKSFYLAYGAAGALLQYVTADLGCILRPHSLKVVYESASRQHMLLDTAAIDSLEVVRPLQLIPGSCNTSSSRHPQQRQQQQQAAADVAASKQYSCLLSFFSHTHTTSGQRLLRSNLLQPLKDVASINLRLDALQDLLESPHLTLELQGLLDQLPKQLDKMCTNLAVRQGGGSSKDPARKVALLVEAIILLRQLLRCLGPLAESMAWVDSALLRAVRANLQQEALQQLLAQVEAVLDDDAQASRAAFQNKVQQCFAVRAEVDSFLDVSRTTFCKLTESVHELADRYRQETETAAKVQYSQARGFYFQVPNPSPGSSGLPQCFLVLEKRGRNTMSVTTHELNALNTRLRDAAADCLMLTEKVLEQLVATALQHMPLLLQVVDSIALLDMLVAFFHTVTGAEAEYVRPELSETGPLAIRAGRHPLLESLPGICYQPNDCYISQHVPLHIIGGPNMSGKSTCLKQVATLVLMAQIGCYVPASFMALRPFDALYTRIGTADSIEANASSFMVEMAEMSSILSRATPRSLVLIDELGRATSSSDGVGIAWAMCEYLMAAGITTLLATHFRRLQELAVMYPGAETYSMQVDVREQALEPRWLLQPAALARQHPHQPQGAAAAGPQGYPQQPQGDAAAGPQGYPQPPQGDAAAGPQPQGDQEAMQHYGISLARSVGMPDSVVGRALQVAKELEQQEAAQGRGDVAQTVQLQQMSNIANTLTCIAQELLAKEHALCPERQQQWQQQQQQQNQGAPTGLAAGGPAAAAVAAQLQLPSSSRHQPAAAGAAGTMDAGNEEVIVYSTHRDELLQGVMGVLMRLKGEAEQLAVTGVV